MHERNVASPVRSIAGRTAQHLSSSTWTCDMTRAWTWIWGLTPTKPVFAKGVAATGVVQPVQSACSPCYLVCIVASRGDVREGFEGLREEADLESLGAMPKYSAGRATTRSGMTKHILRRDLAHRARLIEHGTDQERPATAHLSKRRCQLSVCRSDEVEAPGLDTVGMRSETITVSTCTQRPHRTWSGARTGTRSGSFGFFDCMAEAGTATRGTQPPCGCSTAAGASQAGGRRGRRAGGHRKGDTASLRR